MTNRDKKEKKPLDERKPDISKNTGNLDEIIQRQREREKHLFPVRITGTTVIYVSKKKATREYAEEYKRDKLMKLDGDGKEKKNID